MPPARDRLGGANPKAFNIVVIVLPVEPGLLHEQGPATAEPTTTDQHSFRAAVWNLYFRSQRVMDILRIGRRALAYPDRPRRIGEAGLAPEIAGLKGRIGTLREAIIE